MLPFQTSPAIPAIPQGLSPTPVSFPIKATFVSCPPISTLLVIPEIPSLPRMLPVTLTFSTVAFLTDLARAEMFSIHGILMLTLAKLIFLTEPPSILPNS